MQNILNSLKQGNLSCITSEVVKAMNDITLDFLDDPNPNQQKIFNAKCILEISNILCHNTSRDILPLNDDLYDLLLEKYKVYDPNFQVGSYPVVFQPDNSNTSSSNDELEVIMCRIEDPNTTDFLYADDILKTRQITKEDYYTTIMEPMYRDMPVRRVGDAKHIYKELAGTLDKCKFVLNEQARNRGVFSDSNVKILERDFFGPHLQSGIINTKDNIKICLELKYDGVSVEADVSDQIISARSRGDANEGISVDLTPLLKGIPFPRAIGVIPHNEVFGMQFEAIMTNYDLMIYNYRKGTNYKNCRTAIISLFASQDAFRYRDLITLVPIRTSLDNMDRQTEIEFMNKYYTDKVLMKYSIIEGNYVNILFGIKKFVEEAEYLRPWIPFMYDGVVVSYMDEHIRETLGRVNSINKYSMAIKFNPLKALTTFREYTFTVGQDGVITPMIHYDPVVFYGTVHSKSSGQSYKRFMELGLRAGDIISVEYVNDVMPYVSKPDNQHNEANAINPPIPFLTHCPSCGSELVISKSGKSMFCTNLNCPERNVKRMTSMLDKLDIKDFSEASIVKIGKFKLVDLVKLTKEDLAFLGEVTSQKFIDRMITLMTKPIFDYRIMGALGFEGVATEKWKTILSVYSLPELVDMFYNNRLCELVNIKGVGPGTADIINTQFKFFFDDIVFIMSMPNVIKSKGTTNKTIRFTGIRDALLVSQLNDMGHNAGEGSVSNKTDILIVPSANYTSTKTTKASSNGHTIIVPIDEFRENMNKYLM